MIIYGNKTCYKCKQLVERLKKEGKQFEYVDIDTYTQDQLQALASKYGLGLPIIVE